MNSSQLLIAAENVVSTLCESGVKRAIVEYQRGLASGSVAPEMLEKAASNYLDGAAMYGPLELALVEALKLSQLQSPAFWFDLTATTSSSRMRLARLTALRINLEYASVRLPGVLSLIGGSGFKDTDGDTALVRLRINDAVEKASHPDRLSRLIDGVDMIYQACAELAGESSDELALLSITGHQHRIIEFKGHPEVTTATRRIIRTLYKEASESLQQKNYSVDQIAENIPFMHALDELFRVQALEASAANRIREGVLAGSIMLLECGVKIPGEDFSLPALAPARSVSISDQVSSSEDLQYLDLSGRTPR